MELILDYWSGVLKKSYRVKRDRDFQAIFGAGKSVANRQFVVYSLEKPQAHYRVGISVSKKLGNAVTRNLIKRRIRHAVKSLETGLIEADLVIIARKGVEDIDYHTLRKNLTHVLKLGNLYQEGTSRETKT